MSGNTRKRLERLEEKLADLIKHEALVNCICLDHVFVNSRERFVREIRRACPVHGFRRLGLITCVYIVPGNDITPDHPSFGLDEAIAEYERLLAKAERVEDEREYGFEEH